MSRSTLAGLGPLPLAALVFAVAAMPARAAESYASCTGFIDSLPATITTQGTWCLRKDLATAITSGAAIAVNTNNVTIDCNAFKIGGLQAGPDTMAAAIASERNNVVVRHCNIRGFLNGVFLQGSGHVVEDSRFEGNRWHAVDMSSSPGLIRHNLVVDTGPTIPGSGAIAAIGDVDVVDNTIDWVEGNSAGKPIVAISASGGNGNVISGNRVRKVVNSNMSSFANGIVVGMNEPGRTVVRDNVLFGYSTGIGFGIQCGSLTDVSRGNEVYGWRSFGEIRGVTGCTSHDDAIVD